MPGGRLGCCTIAVLHQRDHGEIDRLPQLVAVQSVGLREMQEQEKWKDEGEKIRDNDSKFQVVYDLGCLPTSPLPPHFIHRL